MMTLLMMTLMETMILTLMTPTTTKTMSPFTGMVMLWCFFCRSEW